MDERGRDGVGGELGADRGQVGDGGAQLGQLVLRQPGGGVDPGEPAGLLDRRQPALRLVGEPGQAAVEAARLEQPVDLGGRLDLQPGQGAQHVLADRVGGVPRQLGAEVGERQPAAVGVNGQGRRHVVGEQRGQGGGDDRFVDEQRGVGDGLEVDVAGGGRRPQDAGELPGSELLHRSGHRLADGVQRVTQPALGGLEPPGNRPGHPAGAGGQLV